MTFSGLLRFITPHRRVLLSILGLLLLGSLASLLNPWIAGEFTGSLIGDVDTKFEDASFSYPGRTGLLSGLNVEIQVGEKSFIEECEQLLRQRTVILITHRPASLALADRILKLENRHF